MRDAAPGFKRERGAPVSVTMAYWSEIVMKKFGAWFCLLAFLAVVPVQAEEERFVDKAGRTIKKGGAAAQEGIEKGASAADKGVGKAFGTVNEKVFKPADSWIQNKVNKKGSSEKPADK